MHRQVIVGLKTFAEPAELHDERRQDGEADCDEDPDL
jgi:hypothetical protein